MILSKPGYITYFDNAAVLQLTQQLSASKIQTQHLSVLASWLHRLVKREDVSMQFASTDHQKADILTKGLTAYMHELAKKGLRLQICDGLWFVHVFFKPSYIMSKPLHIMFIVCY